MPLVVPVAVGVGELAEDVGVAVGVVLEVGVGVGDAVPLDVGVGVGVAGAVPDTATIT